jgi:glycosyltransferase involved in cell wall biosynthesis
MNMVPRDHSAASVQRFSLTNCIRKRWMTEDYFVLAPYREAAIRAISNQLTAKGIAGKHYVASKSFSRAAGKAAKLIGKSSLADRLTGTRTHNESEVCWNLEPVRICIKVLPFGLLEKKWMYFSKSAFDNAVSNKLSSSLRGVVIGMPGACRETFRKTSKAFRVLHQVDAHPRFHNRSLASYYSADAIRRETIPSATVCRIEDEIELADAILSPSTFVTNQFIEFGIKRQKIIQIPYGVDLEGFVPDPHQAPLQREKPTLLYVGQVSLRKGLPFLLKAMGAVSANLRIVGPMVNSIALDKMPRNVSYLGPRSRQEVIRLMNDADAFILPSIEDACALVVAEAVATGLPIITTTANGAGELLDKRDITLIAPGSAAALIDSISLVQPLSFSARLQRAARIRSSVHTQGDGATIRSWQQYADEVLTGIEASRCN